MSQPQRVRRKTKTKRSFLRFTGRPYKVGLISLLIAISIWTISSIVIPHLNLSQLLSGSSFLSGQGFGITISTHKMPSPTHVSVQPHTMPTQGKIGTPTPTSNNKTTPVATNPGGWTGSGVSPLLFGTNMGLFNGNDQVLNSAGTRTLLQQMHTRIIRMPVRTSLSEATEVQAAQIIKSLGAVPLVVLNGALVSNPLANDTIMINDMNRIFGNSLVYYEYGNEEDLNGINVDRYTASWNSVVPQLKRLALNGQFIGPVNFQWDSTYLTSFLQNANPRPDLASWHEYTCDDSWAKNICISHIANWTNHITAARDVMTSTINRQLPIMITEWNYAPNAVPNDGKNNDSAFMSTWTSTALQTLAANHVFASMQYSCTNTAIPMIDGSGTSTVQGNVFKTSYETMIGTQ